MAELIQARNAIRAASVQNRIVKGIFFKLP